METGQDWAMKQDGRGLYFLLWALWPLVFFTPSRNIIATYPLPALPALAILMAEIVSYCAREDYTWRRFHPLHPALAMTSIAGILMLGCVSSLLPELAPKRTERELVNVFYANRKNEDQLLYFGTRKYSAEFYSGGEATATISIDALKAKLNSPGRLFVAIKSRKLELLPPQIQRRLLPVTAWPGKQTNLFVERIDTPELVGNRPARNPPHRQMISTLDTRNMNWNPRISSHQAREGPPLKLDTRPWITCVVPAYNEAEGIARFLKQLCAYVGTLTHRYEVIVVDDGSNDGTTVEVLSSAETLPVQLIRLSRNFGKEAAISAGLDVADGEAVIIIDADFQQPIELIGEFVRLWSEGYEMVYGLRNDRKTDPILRRILSRDVLQNLEPVLRGRDPSRCWGFPFAGPQRRPRTSPNARTRQVHEGTL
jgi:hypothetical protein